MQEFLLVSAALCASALIGVWVIWRFVFRRSLRKVIMAMLGIMMDRVSGSDEAIPTSTEPKLSDFLEARAESAKAETPPGTKNVPQQARIVEHETGEQAINTSFNGWPRPLNRAARAIRRPFRYIRLATESDDTIPNQTSPSSDE